MDPAAEDPDCSCEQGSGFDNSCSSPIEYSVNLSAEDLIVIDSADKQTYVLPKIMADTVSTVAKVARFSVNSVNFISQMCFGGARSGTKQCLALSKDVMVRCVNLVDSTLQILSSSSPDNSDISSLVRIGQEGKTKDGGIYFDLTRYCIAQMFSTAESLVDHSFDKVSHLTSFSLRTLDDSIHLFDGVFGSNDTSHAVASVSALLIRELFSGGDDNYPPLRTLGLQRLMKAFIAYSYIQGRNRNLLMETICHKVLLTVTFVHESGQLLNTRDSLIEDQLRMLFGGPSGKIVNTAEPTTNRYSSETVNTRISWDADSMKLSRSNSVKSIRGANLDNPHLYNIKPFHQSLAHVLENLTLLSRYSSAMYGRTFLRIFGIAKYSRPPTVSFDTLGRRHSEAHVIFSLHTGIPLEAIVDSSFKESDGSINAPQIHVPQYIISLDHKRKLIVATLRGTFALSDVVTSLACEPMSITINDENFQVHSGMFRQAQILTHSTHHFHRTVKEAMEKFADYSLVLVGHSLGGGVASLIGLLWSNLEVDKRSRGGEQVSFWTSRESGLPSHRPLHCYVFSSPCVMCADLACNVRGLVTSLVYENDFISRLSLGSVRDLKKIAWTLAGEDGSETCDEIVKHALRAASATPQDLLSSSPKSTSSSNFASSCDTPLSSSSLFNQGAPAGIILGEFDSSILSNIENSSERSREWFLSIHKTLLANSTTTQVKHYPPGDVFWIRTVESTSPCTPSSSTLETDDDFYQTTDSITRPAAESQSSLDRNQTEETNSGKTCDISFIQINDVEAMFAEMQFSKSMLLDHSPSRYEWGLKALQTASKLS